LAQTGKPTLARTADGHVDLQGIWDFRSATPLERPARFAGREFMTPEEVVEYERLALAREDGRPPDDGRSLDEQSVHPVWWLDYGKTVVKTARTSLIVDPPDGRMPPQTADARARLAARRAEARTHGPADSYENRSLQERCITRGLPEVMLPGPYNNNVQIVQSPGYVMLMTEMIHDARIIPFKAAHADSGIRPWMGDSIARWDGKTLVIDTINFSEKTAFRGSSAALHLIERLTRIDADTIEYRFTIDDPKTWTKQWTGEYTWPATNERIFEYACHEANYAMGNILRGARLREKQSNTSEKK
jgi:hypothetical protein